MEWGWDGGDCPVIGEQTRSNKRMQGTNSPKSTRKWENSDTDFVDLKTRVAEKKNPVQQSVLHSLTFSDIQ